MARLIDNQRYRSVSLNANLHSQEKLMDVPTPAASAEKSLESDMAEDICKLLEQTMLRYFPQTENEAGQPKPSSVPLVPHRQAKPQI
jgi:hypothetical protein